MNLSRWCWLPVLALCAAGCASSSKARPSPSDSATEQRAQELEARNAAMQQELRRKQVELSQSFQRMAQAESAAGLNNLGCVGLAPANAQLQGLPRSGAVHARFLLKSQPHQLTATFAAPRSSGGWRISQGTCKVVRP